MSCCCFYRDDQFDEAADDEWVFGTVRETKPSTRGAVSAAESSQPPAPLSAVSPVNHMEVSAPSPTPVAPQNEKLQRLSGGETDPKNVGVEPKSMVEEEKENKMEDSSRHPSDANRLSNGIDSRPPQGEPVAVISNHSPRTSIHAADDSRQPDLSSTLPNGLGPTDQQVATMGEPSQNVAVGDDGGVARRHDSISEHTKELDELLKRSSVTSVMSDTQEEGALGAEFERIGGSSSGSDEDSGGRRMNVVS